MTEGHILHGYGTLTLKNGMGTYSGEWDNGVMKGCEEELRRIEQEWRSGKEVAKEDQFRFHQ